MDAWLGIIIRAVRTGQSTRSLVPAFGFSYISPAVSD
jgi:hypothetical protein